MKETETKIRLGCIDFVNGLVPDYCLESSIYKKFYAYPAKLCDMLVQDELDISPVSAVEYLVNPNKYYILSEICISSKNSADSVGLFLKKPLESYEGLDILLTAASKTSVLLLKLIIKRFFSKNVSYVPQGKENYLSGSCWHNLVEDGVLLIGDQCQKAKKESNLHFYDLAELWYEKTGYNTFVFALWLVRRSFFDNHPSIVFQYLSEQHKSIEQGLKNLNAIYNKQLPDLDFDKFCQFVTQNMCYGLDEEGLKSFIHFKSLLHEEGLIAKNPDLDFIG